MLHFNQRVYSRALTCLSFEYKVDGGRNMWEKTWHEGSVGASTWRLMTAETGWRWRWRWRWTSNVRSLAGIYREVRHLLIDAVHFDDVFCNRYSTTSAELRASCTNGIWMLSSRIAVFGLWKKLTWGRNIPHYSWFANTLGQRHNSLQRNRF